MTRSKREWEDVSLDWRRSPFKMYVSVKKKSNTDMLRRLKKSFILNSPVMRDKTDRANCAKCCITTKTHLKYLNNLCFSCLVCCGIFKLIYPYLQTGTIRLHWITAELAIILIYWLETTNFRNFVMSHRKFVLNYEVKNICLEKVLLSGWHKSLTIITSHWVVNISVAHEFKMLQNWPNKWNVTLKCPPCWIISFIPTYRASHGRNAQCGINVVWYN